MLAGPSWARQPARIAVSVRERPGTMPPFVEPGPGPAQARPGPEGGAQGREPRAGGMSPGRGAVRRRSDVDAGHVLQGTCLWGWGSVQRVQGVGQGCQRGTAWTGLKNKRQVGSNAATVASKSMRMLYTAGS
jgi:hypothetical protein